MISTSTLYLTTLTSSVEVVTISPNSGATVTFTTVDESEPQAEVTVSGLDGVPEKGAITENGGTFLQTVQFSG